MAIAGLRKRGGAVATSTLRKPGTYATGALSARPILPKPSTTIASTSTPSNPTGISDPYDPHSVRASVARRRAIREAERARKEAEAEAAEKAEMAAHYESIGRPAGPTAGAAGTSRSALLLAAAGVRLPGSSGYDASASTRPASAGASASVSASGWLSASTLLAARETKSTPDAKTSIPPRPPSAPTEKAQPTVESPPQNPASSISVNTAASRRTPSTPARGPNTAHATPAIGTPNSIQLDWDLDLTTLASPMPNRTAYSGPPGRRSRSRDGSGSLVALFTSASSDPTTHPRRSLSVGAGAPRVQTTPSPAYATPAQYSNFGDWATPDADIEAELEKILGPATEGWAEEITGVVTEEEISRAQAKLEKELASARTATSATTKHVNTKYMRTEPPGQIAVGQVVHEDDDGTPIFRGFAMLNATTSLLQYWCMDVSTEEPRTFEYPLSSISRARAVQTAAELHAVAVVVLELDDGESVRWRVEGDAARRKIEEAVARVRGGRSGTSESAAGDAQNSAGAVSSTADQSGTPDAGECTLCFDGTEDQTLLPCRHRLCTTCLTRLRSTVFEINAAREEERMERLARRAAYGVRVAADDEDELEDVVVRCPWDRVVVEGVVELIKGVQK
ncbi:hypothetical protein M427DRAFT_59573 [Gonapodya prolifera JEL478]|uniref:RING-type domain-containing protein n=1 Tax=Gonapodya prolifera (strain JEL478) TaxID=1344416 RepID=A0A139A6I8_GONPJ|nr:hypothetical protein M427DRAFT_59573 [Gonapodya prolifera JEL478]|eukprot:KXS12430.1 hypothetical protein M427DRAFT_59573 [Gonapodya prolifera JEL478]